jgi:hypothetical protein
VNESPSFATGWQMNATEGTTGGITSTLNRLRNLTFKKKSSKSITPAFLFQTSSSRSSSLTYNDIAQAAA